MADGLPARAHSGGRVLPRPASPTRRAIPWGLILVLAAATLPVLWLLVRPGFFTSDDGLFHLYRVQALGDAVRQGVLYPRWFQEFGFGYGQPVLNFYSPLSYYLALPFLPLGPIAATKLVFLAGFVLPALAMYGFARRLWGEAGGVLAAFVYTYFTYHLADGLQRGALAEHLAFLWPPLILWASWALFAGRAGQRADQRPLIVLGLGLAWSGLILTHHLTALMMAPVWGVYVLLLAVQTRRVARLWGAAGGFALAIGLTAFYWIPVIAEAGAVKLGADPISTGYRDHLLPLAGLVATRVVQFYRSQPNEPVQHSVSLLVALLFLAAVALASARGLLGLLNRNATALPRPAFPSAQFVFFAVVALASALLLTTASLPLWQLAEALLSRLQYPWRWLVITALASALVIGALPALLVTGRWRVGNRGLWGGVLVAGALLIYTGLADLPYWPDGRTDAGVTPEQMWAEDAANGQVGATWTAEFLPIGVTEQRWALGRAPEQPQASAPPAAAPIVTLGARAPDRYQLIWEGSGVQPVRWHAFYFPGWQVRIDGQRVPTGASGELGLLTGQVPPGRHLVEIAFENTLPRQVGVVVSALTWWGALLWLLLAHETFMRSRRWLATISLLALVPLLLWFSSFAQARWQPAQVTANLENQALLLGADTPVRVQAGDTLPVTLYWLNLHDTAQNYKAFVHLVDAAGTVRAQQDGDPGGGFSPTSRWRANELILDRHRVVLPPDLPPGPYTIKAGLYQLDPLRNLSVVPTTPDDRVSVGQVEVLAADPR